MSHPLVVACRLVSRLRHLFAALFCAAILLAPVSAQQNVTVPQIVKFSGTISDAPSGAVGVIFALYKDKAGGAPLWQEVQSVTVDAGGHYTSLLGSRSSIPIDVFSSNEARWLGVQAEGQPEQPRILLVSVPYAIKASDAETLGGLPASAFLRADVASTTAAVPASYVNSAAVNSAAANIAGIAAIVATGAKAGSIPIFTDTTGDLGNSALFQLNVGTAANPVWNFGIGTTTPGAVLDVNGNTRLMALNQGSRANERYYPNVISQEQNTTSTGAWIIHTPISRSSNLMIMIHVHGYGYGTIDNIDFTISGYPSAGGNGPDGKPGTLVRTRLSDIGTDTLNKWVGIDANGNVAIALGNATTSAYYYRISADAWITNTTSDYSAGWSIDQNATAGFGWIQSYGPLTSALKGTEYITPTGNVGIGTSTPGGAASTSTPVLLEVNGKLVLTKSSGGSITFQDGTTQTTAGLSGTVAIAHGGTGSTTATTARTSLGAAASGANSDITSLAGLTTPLSVAQGGTGSTTKNFVDLSSTQTIPGAKTFSSPIAGSITGNAATATSAATAASVINGVYTTVSYADPAWLTALSAAKLTGTVAKTSLPSNVALTNAANTFTAGTQDFSGAGATLTVRALLTAATPPTCVAAKELLVKTDATPGEQLFICNATGTGWVLVGDGNSGAVFSFDGRTGAVTAQTGDYSFAQIGGTATDAQIAGLSAGKLTGTVGIANGGTGSTTAAAARTALGAAARGVNADITSLAALTTPLSVSQGGTGSTTKNFVDLSSTQTIAGTKTFSSPIAGSITGNAATVSNGAYTNASNVFNGNQTIYGTLSAVVDVIPDGGGNNSGAGPSPGFRPGNGGEGIASNRANSATGTNQYGLDFYTNWTNRLSITNGGNVGIGTTTPASPLTVAGAIQSTGGGFVFPDTTTQTTATPANLTTLSTQLGTSGYNGQNFRYAADCMIGDIILSVNAYGGGGGAVPADGSLLPIVSYPVLFQVLGTNFGGDGVTNFAVPDMRAFAPKGLQYSICVLGIFPGRN